jgi:hypothetical protein
MNSHFESAVAAIPALFERMMASTMVDRKNITSLNKLPGIYIFFENDVPVHVGRTRDMARRLRDHVQKTHNSASFAFKRAQRQLGKSKKDGSRSSLLKDPVFMTEFLRQIEMVRSMRIGYVEVADPIQQYLLELYSHLELDLPLNEFDTH